MNRHDRVDPRLREACEALARDARPGPDCPPVEDFWSAVRGELPAEETRRIGTHTIACAACAELWRLAREVGAAPVATRPAVSRRRLGWAAAAVVAAAALTAFVGVRQAGRPGEAPGYRAPAADPAIRSRIPEGSTLARRACRLLWRGPEGAVYTVRVTAGDLSPILEATDLRDPALTIPPERLEALPDGAVLLWKVTAALPDGGVVSRAFSTPLADGPAR